MLVISNIYYYFQGVLNMVLASFISCLCALLFHVHIRIY